SLKVLESVGEEDLALEASERWEKFEEEHAGIAADQRRSLHGPQLAADVGAMGRGVVLHFLGTGEVIIPDGFFGFLADALAPTESSESLIGELRPGSQQLFVDAHEVALAARVELQDLVTRSEERRVGKECLPRGR